ncbi:MAG TPA: hypothetical protein VFG15_03200 [Amycolatopsis sp.]|nr:hypothetical protein [Amycolatopsis sp.]
MWTNDSVQFARLLSELEAAGGFEGAMVSSLVTSMDLSESEVIELKDRAVRLWDEVLQHANPAAWIGEVMGSEGLWSTSDG